MNKDNMLIAIDGLRGIGKSFLIEQLKQKYSLKLFFNRFPSDTLRKILDVNSVDWNNPQSIINYNMLFVTDFIKYKNLLKEFNPVILDRYILSNLVHFCFDLKENGFSDLWEGISLILYSIYSTDNLILRPDIQICLYGNTNQPAPRFDDSKYKTDYGNRLINLFYSTEMYYVTKYCGAKTYWVKSFQPDNGTFIEVENILKEHSII